MKKKAVKPSPNELNAIVNRAVSEIIPYKDFVNRLNNGDHLRLKMGFDPSAPDLHLGHVVGLRKLRQLQNLGHTVVVIVGDWTARIGDPSGRSATRPMLTSSEVANNAETYMSQFFKVVDEKNTEIRYQSEWFEGFGLEEILRLSAQFTVNQFLHREDFSQRYASENPIGIVELLYPLLQAYDSVAVNADVEFGGTDQRFNLLVGRDLQEKNKQKPQNVFLVPILPGTDGVRRMGKSLGNYIALEDKPNDMYGKLMSIPDVIVPLYYDLLTDFTQRDIDEIRDEFEKKSPRLLELKKALALKLTSEFHGQVEGRKAEESFESVIQQGGEPEDILEIGISPLTPGVIQFESSLFTLDLPKIAADAGIINSRSEGMRLLKQGAILIDGNRATDAINKVSQDSKIRFGRLKWIRIVASK
ncbi:MAG: tyrosine--tRNA ligase [Dehalococcoidia bacterium]|nr:tyrosine--tRNA ligase [Dehalococcoidia bacterium]|tara:strand:- start:322 stop:1569 length:1248 start_codon:yes stop_codon:yes gene_type:complete